MFVIRLGKDDITQRGWAREQLHSNVSKRVSVIKADARGKGSYG